MKIKGSGVWCETKDVFKTPRPWCETAFLALMTGTADVESGGFCLAGDVIAVVLSSRTEGSRPQGEAAWF